MNKGGLLKKVYCPQGPALGVHRWGCLLLLLPLVLPNLVLLDLVLLDLVHLDFVLLDLVLLDLVLLDLVLLDQPANELHLAQCMWWF